MRRGQRRREEPSRGDGEMRRGVESSLQGRLETSKERWRDEEGTEKQREAIKKR